MGHSHGFKWGEEIQQRLKELVTLGISTPTIVRKLSKEFKNNFNYEQINQAKKRFGFQKYLLCVDDAVKTYKELTLPDDDYMVSCDYHSPYHSEVWVNRYIAVADRFKIKKNVVIGDLFEFHFIMSHYTEEGRDIEKEIHHTEPVIKALDYFEKNYVLQGNHERRIGIQTNSLIQAKHLFGLFGADIWRKKFQYSVYDKMNIGKKWLLVHPKSYSQVATSVGKRLCEKFHRHSINAHGHLWGSTYDRSGKFRAIDLGHMIDRKKVGYINLRTTTHPTWKNGFGMIYKGHFYHFGEDSDWKFWI